jgi:copper transport protein
LRPYVNMKPSFRWPFRIFGAALLAFGAMLITGAPPAWAHANLVSTEPEYGATFAASPPQVVIRYDLPVEVKGAQVKVERPGERVRLPQPPRYASLDHKDMAVPLPELGGGKYLLTWFLFGSDGDVMGGELAFTVLGSADRGVIAPSPGIGSRGPRKRSFAPLSQAQDAARLVSVASLIILIGGVTFGAALWRPGIQLRRTRILLSAALAGAIGGNAAALGLRGAAVSGRSALSLFSSTALTALGGTHVGRVLTARLVFLVLAVPFLVYLLAAPQRAFHSDSWRLGSIGCGVGALVTHGMLSHAAQRGPLASAADAVHLGAIAIWLGGLVTLAVVLLPRRRSGELALILPRWSHLAFDSVSIAVVAGAVLLLFISPRWSAMLGSPYGQFLLLKLTLVAVLLAAARKARDFVWDRLPIIVAESVESDARTDLPVPVGATVGGHSSGDTVGGRGPDPAPRGWVGRAPLQPLVTAVTAELCLAASILTATAVLVGRPPPT